ncbi:MAG: hypothetical protein H0X65_08590 [Gemmatimonadetes bacterium]|nr:hypothetical protein [Gemmatimonadota bacterium]
MNQFPGQRPVPPARTARSGFSSFVRTLAERIHKVEVDRDEKRHREFSSGDQAMLRRLSPERDTVPPEAYWRLLPQGETDWSQRAFWYALLPLLVRHPHAEGTSLGTALARAGVSEARVERWLRRTARDARADAPRLFSRLVTVDWTEAGPLLRYWRQRDRWRVADDFFSTPREQ